MEHKLSDGVKLFELAEYLSQAKEVALQFAEFDD